ncbi:MAG: glycosyltransferase family 2 protein [Elusimicrobia bacterium]|nr:glycosyltransferase family 2 protein [Elusimicrobiota bacterium]
MVKDQPSVSVVISIYNEGNRIEETIQSILNQSFQNFEVLLVEDVSENESSLIIKRLQKSDSRLVYLYNEFKIGFVRSLNLGLSKSNGKYIARIDSGDLWERDKLKIQMELFKKQPELCLLGTQVFFINEDGNLIGQSHYPLSKKEIGFWILKGNNPIMHSSAVFRNGTQYNESFSQTEDLELWSRLFLKGEAANLKQPLVKYRLSANSLSLIHRPTDIQNSLNIATYFFMRLTGKEAVSKYQRVADNRVFSYLYRQGTRLKYFNFYIGQMLILIAHLFYPRLFFLRIQTKIFSMFYIYKYRKMNEKYKKY